MGWGLAFGLFGLPFSPSSLSSFFSRSLTLISFPRQTSFAIENGYPQCMLCDGHCLIFLCSFDIRILCFLLPNQMQIQASTDFICYLNWTGAFSWFFSSLLFYWSHFVVSSLCTVRRPGLLHLFLYSGNLIVNDIEQQKERLLLNRNCSKNHRVLRDIDQQCKAKRKKTTRKQKRAQKKKKTEHQDTKGNSKNSWRALVT